MSKVLTAAAVAILAGLSMAACEKADDEAMTSASDEISSPAVDTRLNPPPVETVGAPPPALAPAPDIPPKTAAAPADVQRRSQVESPPR